MVCSQDSTTDSRDLVLASAFLSQNVLQIHLCFLGYTALTSTFSPRLRETAKKSLNCQQDLTILLTLSLELL